MGIPRCAPFADAMVETMVAKNAAEKDGVIIGLIMGSESDWKTMGRAADTLDDLGVRYEKKVVSAHRTPDDLFAYAENAEKRGLALIIAGAGGAAHLPGMTASKTILPVIGVPVVTTPLNGLDALLSIMQMPAEVGVATVNVGLKGAVNAALLAAAILARENALLAAKLRSMQEGSLRAAQATTKNLARSSGSMVSIFAECETDLETMQHAANQFDKLEMPYSIRVIGSATPLEELTRYVRAAEEEGTAAFIAGSGQGIDLACKLAGRTILPVFGVPIVSGQVECIDRFLQSILEMPSGTATFAIGRAGAINAALFAATILSAPGSKVRDRLHEMRKEQVDRVRAMKI